MTGVYDLFQRALRRTRFPVPLDAASVLDDDGARVVFSAEIRNGAISRVDYRCTTCATLIAACEAITEAAPGMDLADAGRLTSHTLAAWFPEVPPSRQSRLGIAVAAFHAALSSKACDSPLL